MNQRPTCAFSFATPAVTCTAYGLDDYARLGRLLKRPLVVFGVLIAMALLMLLSVRLVAPYLPDLSAGSATHYAVESNRDTVEERRLEAQIDEFLASFETQPMVVPANNMTLP